MQLKNDDFDYFSNFKRWAVGPTAMSRSRISGTDHTYVSVSLHPHKPRLQHQRQRQGPRRANGEGSSLQESATPSNPGAHRAGQEPSSALILLSASAMAVGKALLLEDKYEPEGWDRRAAQCWEIDPLQRRR